MTLKNIFIYGMSGSGKDTIANNLKDDWDFMKLRVADTVKRIICEKCGITFDELEIIKRNNNSFRILHNKVGIYLDKDIDIDIYLDANQKPQNGTNNRITQLINGTALDYQHFSSDFIKQKSKVICDCRSLNWCESFLNAGWTGIFLTRTTKEYKNSAHFTEENIYNNGKFSEFCNIFDDKSKIKVIDNSDKSDKISLNFAHDIPVYHTDTSSKQLLEVVKQILTDIYNL